MEGLPSLRLRRIALLLGCLALVALTWFSPVDSSAEATVDAGLKRAFAAFAVARGMNAAISMLQGTEISVGLGVNATLSVGEVIDPFNDLVEQFSDLMLLASVSFGIQKLLLATGQLLLLKAAVVVVLLEAARRIWFAASMPRWLPVFVLVGLFARFAVPVTVVVTGWVSTVLLEERYESSSQALVAAEQEVREASTDATVKVRQWLDGIKARLDASVENLVNLIVIFLFETVIVPLGILWGLYALAKRSLRSLQRPRNAQA